MFLRLSQRSFCWRLFAVTQGEMSWYAVWWLPGHPRSAHDATQVTPPVWCNGVSHRENGCTWSLRRGRIPLRCALCYHLTNQLPLIVHLISWLTSTIHSWTNVHPCKVSVSQGLKLTYSRTSCKFTKPTYPIIYTYPISLPFNLMSADSWCWCGKVPEGRSDANRMPQTRCKRF